MRGTVVKRPDAKGRAKYYVVIDETDKVTGHRRRRWHTDPDTGMAFRTEAAAEDHCTKIMETRRTGSYVTPSNITAGAYLATWLSAIRPTVKASTWASYEKNIRLHVAPQIGSVELQHINGLTLDALYAELLATGRSDGSGGGLSPRTVRYVATILGRALKDATRKRLIPRNPAQDADPPSAGAAKSDVMVTWTAAETARFLTAIADHHYGPVITFIALTGCRRGEALGLRWRDLRLDGPSPRASLRQSVGKVAGQTIVGSTKSGKGRAIALDLGLVTALKAHRIEQNEWRLQMGAGWRDLDLVFPNVHGGYQAPETVSRVFRELNDRLGLPRIRLHDLRHGWATLALESDVHPKVVQERLGHANIGITLDIYSHVSPGMHNAAAETVASLIWGGETSR